MKHAYRVNELAAALGISRETIRRRIASGQIKVTRLGRSVLIPADEVERLLDGDSAAPVALSDDLRRFAAKVWG